MTGDKQNPEPKFFYEKTETDGQSKIAHQADIEAANRINPEYKKDALRWMDKNIGYIPHEGIYMPYLAVFQTQIKNLFAGIMSLNDFTDSSLPILTHIRNDDMKKGGWLESSFKEEKFQYFYEDNLGIYKDKARKRLCSILGFEPPVEHSFEAEMLLRHFMASDEYYENMPATSTDFKAATIALYRNSYETDGEEMADTLNFMGLMYEGERYKPGT